MLGQRPGRGSSCDRSGHRSIRSFQPPTTDPDQNPAPRALYVLLWVAWYRPAWWSAGVRVVNPLRALHRLVLRVARLPIAGCARCRAGWGTGRRPWGWPFSSGWSWSGRPGRSGVVGGFLLGTPPHHRRRDRLRPGWSSEVTRFEVYSVAVARWLDRAAGRRAGAGAAHPFRGLKRVVPAPGLVAVLAVWWGSRCFTGSAGTPWWATTSQLAAALGVPAQHWHDAPRADRAVRSTENRGMGRAGEHADRSRWATRSPITRRCCWWRVPWAGATGGSSGCTRCRGARALLIAAIQGAAILVGHVVGARRATTACLGAGDDRDGSNRSDDQTRRRQERRRRRRQRRR